MLLHEVLLEQGADPTHVDVDGSTSLINACNKYCYHYKYEFIEFLLKAGADATTTVVKASAKGTQKLPVGANALMAASAGMRMDLEFKSTKEDYMATAMEWAQGIVKLFVKSGLALDAVDAQGQTALHYAAREGFDLMVFALLDNGAPPCLLDKEGRSPMDLLVKANQTLTDYEKTSPNHFFMAMAMDNLRAAVERHELLGSVGQAKQSEKNKDSNRL